MFSLNNITTKNRSSFHTILISALTVGILDGMAVSAAFYFFFKLYPFQVMQFIASSIYGKEAFDGNSEKIIVGIIVHSFSSFVIAIVYFYLYPRVKLLQSYPVIGGLCYGLVFWIVMNLLIIPNTNIQPSPVNLNLAIVSIVWHMVLVGLPASLITNNHYRLRIG